MLKKNCHYTNKCSVQIFQHSLHSPKGNHCYFVAAIPSTLPAWRPEGIPPDWSDDSCSVDKVRQPQWPTLLHLDPRRQCRRRRHGRPDRQVVDVGIWWRHLFFRALLASHPHRGSQKSLLEKSGTVSLWLDLNLGLSDSKRTCSSSVLTL